MNLFSDQISAAGARQLEAQLQLFRNAAGSALDGAEQLAALQFAATRGALEESTELLRQVAAVKDPRDLFALAGHSQSQLDSVLAYQRKLFGIVTAMTGAVAGLPRAISPAASAALQKLAALPPLAEVTVVADRIIEQTNEVVEELADDTAPADPAPVVDDILEQADEPAEQPLAAPTTAAAASIVVEPIAALSPIAAAAGHQEPQASAAPFTAASPDTPIEVEHIAPVDATPSVKVVKSGGRQRKK